jgi:hypothetical protein
MSWSHSNVTHWYDCPTGVLQAITGYLQEINGERRSRSQWQSQESDLCARCLIGNIPRRESHDPKPFSMRRSTRSLSYRAIWTSCTRHYSQCPAWSSGVVATELRPLGRHLVRRIKRESEATGCHGVCIPRAVVKWAIPVQFYEDWMPGRC